MDEVDIANDLAMKDLEYRLASRARPAKMGPEVCEECEEPMIQLRRDLGLKMCVDCARERERLVKLFARD